MHVRPITRADLSRVTDIGAEAFTDDELHVWIAPRARQYPTGWRSSLALRQKARLVQPGLWGIVCVDDNDEILGYSWWQRCVPKSNIDGRKYDAWLQNNQSLAARFEAKAIELELKYRSYFNRDPSVDAANLQRLIADSVSDGCLAPLENKVTHWYLASLAVAPEAQRRGVGAAMLKWGIDLARQETRDTGTSVPISLTSSVPGMGLYSKTGFKIVDWMRLTADPTIGFQAGCAFVWDPEKTWIRDVSDGVSQATGKKIEVTWTDRLVSA